MASDLRILRISPPVKGVGTTYNPRSEPNGMAADMRNFVHSIYGAGYVFLRRGVVDTQDVASVNASTLANGYLSLNLAVLTNAYNAATTADLVTFAMFNATPSINQWGGGAGSPKNIYGKGVELNGVAYGINATSGKVIKWDGTVAGGLADLANGPTGIGTTTGSLTKGTVASHLGRLWVGSGVPPAGGTYSGTNLYWTIGGGSPTDTAASADWKDPSSGLVNVINLDQNTSNPILALGKIGQYLGILRRYSLWLLTGSTTADFAVRQVNANIGHSANQGSILELDNAVIFNSDKGLMRWDGVNVVELTAPIAPEWRAWSYRSQCFLAALDNEWIMCSFKSTVTVGPKFVYVCHIPTLTWTKWDFPTGVLDQTGSFPSIIVGNRGDGQPFMYDTNKHLADFDQLGGRPHIEDNARQKFADILGFGGATNSTIRPAYYITAPAQLAAPMQKVKLQRVMIDYAFDAFDTSETLTLTALDGSGNTLGGPFQLTDTNGVWTRSVFDVLSETPDLVCRVDFADSASPRTVVPTNTARVGDIWAEYTVAQQPRM